MQEEQRKDRGRRPVHLCCLILLLSQGAFLRLGCPAPRGTRARRCHASLAAVIDDYHPFRATAPQTRSACLHSTMGKGGYTKGGVPKEPQQTEVYLYGKRVDVTRFLHSHPGGAKALKIFANRDATEQFIMCAPACHGSASLRSPAAWAQWRRRSSARTRERGRAMSLRDQRQRVVHPHPSPLGCRPMAGTTRQQLTRRWR